MVKKILIVDDSAFIRMALRDILIDNGYEVVGEADSGRQAVEKFKDLHPDLITLDVVMSGESGVDTLREIIQLDRNAKALMVTAMGKQSMIVEAIQAGAKGFLIKPFQADAVAAEVKRILGG